MLFNKRIKRRQFIDDVKSVKSNTSSLLIKGEVKNFELLPNLKSLKKVELFTVNQEQFDRIAPYLQNIKELRMYEVRCENLSYLGKLRNLEKLDIEWNTKIKLLWDFSENESLIYLRICDFSKLQDIASISTLKNIQTLYLEGGIWNKLILDSIRPLGDLRSLEELTLANFKVKDELLLRPLTNLKQLNKLNLPNQFPTEEYARLSVELPNTKCDSFQAYMPINPIGDKDVMVTGSRKPFLSSKRDKEKLQKYKNEFAELQEKFKTHK